MANNRMWLVNDRLKLKVLLAKYMPGSWYTPTTDVTQSLEMAFDRDEEQSQYGEMDWRVLYDMEDGVTGEVLEGYRTVAPSGGEPL